MTEESLEARVARLEEMLRFSRVLKCPASLNASPCVLVYEHDGPHWTYSGIGMDKGMEWESSIQPR